MEKIELKIRNNGSLYIPKSSKTSVLKETEEYQFLIEDKSESLSKAKKLVDFPPSYKYPYNLSLGYWGKYPVERGLSIFHKENRDKWIEVVNSTPSFKSKR